MPLPPPPADAFRSTGNSIIDVRMTRRMVEKISFVCFNLPIPRAALVRVSTDWSSPLYPGMTGTLGACSAKYRLALIYKAQCAMSAGIGH